MIQKCTHWAKSINQRLIPNPIPKYPNPKQQHHRQPLNHQRQLPASPNHHQNPQAKNSWNEIPCPSPIRTGAYPTPRGRWSRKSTAEMCRALFASKWHRFDSAHLNRWFVRSTAPRGGTGHYPDWTRTGDRAPKLKSHERGSWVLNRSTEDQSGSRLF